MLVNKDSISAVFRTVSALFNNSLKAADPQWKKLAMMVPSTTSQNDYSWLSAFPKMREWLGDKVIKQLKAYSYTIQNRDWEATIEVKRNDIEDDNLGIYRPQAEMAGYSAAYLPDEIVADLINDAATNLGIDGKPFLATDHQVNGSSVSNTGTKKLDCSTLAKAQGSYGAARTAMRKITDEEGRPLGIKPNILLVPPALEDTARTLLTVDKLEDGKPNPYKGTAELVVFDRLSSDTAWFLLDTSRPVKPFIYQQRKAPVLVSQTDMNADGVFMRGTYLYGAEARAAGGYGFWQLAWGSTGTVA